MKTGSDLSHLRDWVSENRFSKIQDVLQNRQRDLTVIIENIHDPHNVGAIFRSADAVGIDEIQLLYTKESFPTLHPKVTASGAKWVKQNKYDNPGLLAADLRDRRFNIYSTQLSADAIPIHKVDWTLPSAIILGNENRGVSSAMAKLADNNIIIPMFGMVESLNVSVATAVILFEACRQRISAGLYPRVDHDPAWLEKMTQAWVQINR